MQQLETDLNYISSLPDRPAMATQDLKREFDKAGNVIKDYINNIMIPDLTTFQTNLEASVANQMNSLRGELEERMNTLQTTLEGELRDLQNTVNTALTQGLDSKTSYGDLVITEENTKDDSTGLPRITTNIQYGEGTCSDTITKTGYKPIGLVGGWYMTRPAGSNTNRGSSRYCSGAWTVRENYVSNLTANSITIFTRANSNPNHENIHDEIQVNYRILWVKVR